MKNKEETDQQRVRKNSSRIPRATPPSPEAPNAARCFSLWTLHMLGGQMSEVSSLIVMIMSGSVVGGGLGVSVREKMSFGEWNGGRVRYWESCPVIFPVIPRLLLWKHSHSFWIPDPCCCGNLTDDRASLTPHQSPPTLHPLGYLSWLGWVYLEAN